LPDPHEINTLKEKIMHYNSKVMKKENFMTLNDMFEHVALFNKQPLKVKKLTKICISTNGQLPQQDLD
jgi:hypothetical protein